MTKIIMNNRWIYVYMYDGGLGMYNGGGTRGNAQVYIQRGRNEDMYTENSYGWIEIFKYL